ncbi:hypothetical protein SAMN06265348_12129 [Pedobacter westerhofensis]|uniref:Uncharacterized protein n=1 Tax=Pedobacter westerhofensis TaxID=425512 RepID=A0A521FUP0_9SPHI|nr:hypothetical protein [Pedobacter westerhofensis]SMO99261.1 hypothetical protein SAMN06265348_12129 [Pedobacter westerhofensis]
MSIKALVQTRWKLEPDRVTIYPYGLSYILSAVLAVLFAGILFVYIHYQNSSLNTALPLVLVLLVIVVLFWGFAGTSIEFDQNSGVMRKKLMGFLPITRIPFSKLQGISSVSNLYGSYKYRLFRKDAKYGKGIVVSCAYTKNEDPNAIAFVEEAVTIIHQYLDVYVLPTDYISDPITTYKYFVEQGDKFLLKKNKIGSTIFGLVLFGIGIHELMPGAWLGNEWAIGRVFMLIFLIFGGAAIFFAGYTDVTFDTINRTLERKSPIGLGNKLYSFDDFNGIQTVRKSTNFIYSGTDVQLFFVKRGTAKEEAIVLKSFNRSSKVERFIQEVDAIMIDRSQNVG